jgi:hypothetical protein
MLEAAVEVVVFTELAVEVIGRTNTSRHHTRSGHTPLRAPLSGRFPAPANPGLKPWEPVGFEDRVKG